MVRIPYQHMLDKIHKQTNIPKSDIEKQINDKLEELSGLLSKEGAAHIIANQYKVDLIPDPNSPVALGDIVEGLSGCTVVGKVMTKYDASTFTHQQREGRVQSIMLADATAQLRATFWNEAVDLLDDINQGDIIRISQVQAKTNQGNLQIHVNAKSTVLQNPDNISIPQVASAQPINASFTTITDIPQTGVVKVGGVIVQAFAPTFYQTKDNTQGQVMNVVLDDGTDSIRLVLFGDLVPQVIGISQDKLDQAQKDAPSLLQLRKEVLGACIIVQGRVTVNSRFERKEIIVNQLEQDAAAILKSYVSPEK